MRNQIIRMLVACALLAAVTVGVGAPAAADSEHQDLADARSATAKFHRFEAALDDDRFELADLNHLTCIEDPGGAGAMGVHWVNLALALDGEIDVTQPEALLYDPSGEKPRLLGVEYVVFVANWEHPDPPVLFGHEFHLVEAGNRFGLPAFYELHAWIWSHNPNGMFEDWNPRIDC